jgi:hypothetical protein
MGNCCINSSKLENCDKLVYSDHDDDIKNNNIANNNNSNKNNSSFNINIINNLELHNDNNNSKIRKTMTLSPVNY